MKWRKTMNYRKAERVLPEELIVMIQEYIDGEYLYIPRKQGFEKKWGEKNGSRKLINMRNHEIYLQYKNGYSISELAVLHFLSEKSIYKVIAKEKNRLKTII